MPRKNKKGWGLDVVKRYFADSLQQSPYYPVLPTPFFPAGPPHPFFPFLISSHPALPVPSLSLSARSSADSAARRSAAIDTANCAVSAPRGGLKRIARGAPRAGGRRARAPAQPVSLADTEALARRPPPRPPPQAGARVTVGNHVNNVLATRGDDGAGRCTASLPASMAASKKQFRNAVWADAGAELSPLRTRRSIDLVAQWRRRWSLPPPPLPSAFSSCAYRPCPRASALPRSRPPHPPAFTRTQRPLTAIRPQPEAFTY
ncbi:Protein of unknown function [Gryllus bimaculatus]|nr:Protein of unknown function [Gryllus bimaculatus]